MEKIRHGVLEVQTDHGLLYVRPSLGERIRLLWTFRNFQLLPQQVLNQRELTLIAALLQRGEIQQHGDCRIGIIEWPVPLTSLQPSSLKEVSSTEAHKENSSAANQGSNNRARSKTRHRKNRSQRIAPLQARN